MKKVLLLCLVLLCASPAWAVIPDEIGWYEIPNTKMQDDFFCASQGACSSYWGTTGPSAIMTAWGGGVWDSNEYRLLMFGGGHGDYGGNDIYALKLYDSSFLLNPSMVLVSNPFFDAGTTCINSDNSPCGRHGYDNFTYNPIRHLFVIKGGSRFPNAGTDHIAFTKNLRSGGLWANLGSGGCQSDSSPGDNIEYDADLNMYFCHATFNFYSAPAGASSLTWTLRGNDGSPPGNIDSKYTLIDTKRHQYVDFTPGYAQITRWALTASGTITVSKAALPGGCASFYDASGDFQNAGIEYDSQQDLYALWDGGRTIQYLNPNTLTCSSVTPAMISGTTPPSPTANGTYGKFRYVPHLNLYVLCISSDLNCYTLRITANDFATRSTGAGVVLAEGFDTLPACTSNNVTGLHPNDQSSCANMTLDTSIKASGTGSLKMIHPAGNTNSNGTGFYWAFHNLCTANNGQNCHFHVQFQHRISPEFSTNRRTGLWDSYWKFVILGRGGNSPSTCGQIELTSVIMNFEPEANKWPIIYTGCSAPTLKTNSTNYTFASSGTLYHQSTAALGANGFSCITGASVNENTGNGTGCFNFAQSAFQNIFLTWYYDVWVGTWGQPNSVVKAYVAWNGGPYHQWINIENMSLSQDACCTTLGYGLVSLQPYMTGLSVPAPVDAEMWYDDLIISGQPIPAPGAAATSSTPPSYFNPRLNLRVSDSTIEEDVQLAQVR